MMKWIFASSVAVVATGALLVHAFSADAAPNPTQEQYAKMEKAYQLYAFPPTGGRVAELGHYACIPVDIGGAETIACGESLTDPNTPLRLTADDCLRQGGNFCYYPWEPGVAYCCGIQLGAPPRIE